MLRPRYADHAIARERFSREAIAASRVESAHVLRPLDIVTTPDGRPAIISARLPGEDLQQHLNRRAALPPRAALDIASQALRGLAAAHAAGVVHRDIKPSNLFLSPGPAGGAPRVRILDFGVAKLGGAAEITKEGAVVGTPAYMPPEQAAGRPVDARGDLYSVGALLYRMLSGRPPYTGGADIALGRVLAGSPPPLHALAPELPTALVAICERAMARDPEARYDDATEMLRAIEAARAELPEAELRKLPTLRSHRRAQLRAAAAAFGGWAVLVALVGAALGGRTPGTLATLGLGAAAMGVAAWLARGVYGRLRDARALHLYAADRFRAARRSLIIAGVSALVFALVGERASPLAPLALTLCMTPLLWAEARGAVAKRLMRRRRA